MPLKNRIIKLLPRSEFAKHVLMLGGGTTLVQFIGIIASPILTRLYIPSDYGLWAVMSSLLTMGSMVSTLRYDAAIAIVENEEAAQNLFWLSLIAVVACSIVLAVLLILSNGAIASRLSADARFRDYQWVLPLGVLTSGLYLVLNSWATRIKEFKAITSSRIYQSTISIVIQLGFGAFKAGFIGLILAGLAAISCGMGRLWKEARRYVRFSNLFNFYNLFQTAKVYYRYPSYVLWISLFNAASVQVPVVLLSSFFGSHVTGLYALGYRLVMLPSSLVTSSVSNVFLSRAGEVFRRGSMQEAAEKLVGHLALISAPCFMILLFFAPELFGIAFGETWREAGVYTQYFSPWCCLTFMLSPLTVVVLLANQQGTDMLWQGLLISTRIGSFYLGSIWLGNPRAAIALFAGTTFITSLIYFIWVLKISRVRLWPLVASIGSELTYSLAILFSGKTLSIVLGPSKWIMFGAIVFVVLQGGIRGLRVWRAI